MFTNQFAKRKPVVPTASLFELTSVLLEYTLVLLRVHSDKTSDNIIIENIKSKLMEIFYIILK